MKKISLEKTNEFDEPALLKSLMGPSAPQGGFTIEQVRVGIKVLDKLDAGGPLLLEDTEWQFVENLVKNARWVTVDRHIVLFVDKVSNAEVVS